MTQCCQISGGDVFPPPPNCSQLSACLCVHLGLPLFDAEDDTRVTNRGAVLGDSRASPACAAPDLQHAAARSLPGGIYGNFAVLSNNVAPCCATAACAAHTLI